MIIMSKPKPSRAQVNFVLLKQILEDESSENIITDEGEDESVHSKSTEDKDNEIKEQLNIKEKDLVGPVGRYPVTFSKRCKSKSCQTRLSAFPLFPVPEETEWISDDEESCGIKRRTAFKKSLEKRKRKQRQSQLQDSTSNSNTQKSEKKKGNDKEEESLFIKTRNSDGTRKEFVSEHQLNKTQNPVLKVWIHQKNKLARKMRREERKENRAKRAALEEEERIKSERYVESEKSVRQWLKKKRREARLAWRQNHHKVSPFDMADTTPSTTPPPPEYTVIKSFNCSQSPRSKSRNGSVFNISTKKSTSCKKTSGSFAQENQNTYTSEPRQKSRILKDQVIDIEPQNDINIQKDRLLHKGVKLRPKSAAAGSLENNAHVPTGTTAPRPQTAKGAPNHSKTARCRVNTADSPRKMQSVSYDEWLECKRDEDKKSLVKKKREMIDSHLGAVIAELGKRRVEKILSPRKQVDTGLKNFNRSPEKPKSPHPAKKENPYRWVSNKKLPRPEPQGCDCPDSEHSDTLDVSSLDLGDEHVVDSLSPRKQAVTFCKEVTDQCDELKPSMDKVLAVLDAEIKKCSIDKKSLNKNLSKTESESSTTGATAGSGIIVGSPETDSASTDDGSNLKIGATRGSLMFTVRPMSARPKSARPKSALVGGTRLTMEEVKKQISSNMDVLGLLDSKDTGSISTDKVDCTFSTVRENYFDYGSDADQHVPTMKLD